MTPIPVDPAAASGPVDRVAECEALRAEVERLRKSREALARRAARRMLEQRDEARAQLAMAREAHVHAIERHIGLGMAVWRAIADAEPLVEIVDLIGDDFNAVDAVDDEAIELFEKARAAALASTALADAEARVEAVRCRLAELDEAFQEWEGQPNLYSPGFAARFLREHLNDALGYLIPGS